MKKSIVIILLFSYCLSYSQGGVVEAPLTDQLLSTLIGKDAVNWSNQLAQLKKNYEMVKKTVDDLKKVNEFISKSLYTIEVGKKGEKLYALMDTTLKDIKKNKNSSPKMKVQGIKMIEMILKDTGTVLDELFSIQSSNHYKMSDYERKTIIERLDLAIDDLTNRIYYIRDMYDHYASLYGLYSKY